ncbi:MAG: CopK family periplasmic copper-binding protein [Chromatiaceae bacterium]|nr:CopK family periplasmic copper-binding protein [Chromatiaceae bacterium]
MRVFKSLMAVALTTALFAAIAAEPPADRYELKDGSTLYVHPDGTMRMIDAHGKPLSMKDGVEMDLKDGRTLLMKNRRIWIQVGPPGKGFQYQRTE